MKVRRLTDYSDRATIWAACAVDKMARCPVRRSVRRPWTNQEERQDVDERTVYQEGRLAQIQTAGRTRLCGTRDIIRKQSSIDGKCQTHVQC